MFIIRFFQMGGLFMLPIALTLAVGLAIAFERWVSEAGQPELPQLIRESFDELRAVTAGK